MNWTLTPDRKALRCDPYRIKQNPSGRWALYAQPWMFGCNIPTRRLVGMYETIAEAKKAAEANEITLATLLA